MINFNNFYQIISNNSLFQWLETIPMKINIWKKYHLHKNFTYWNKLVELLPIIIPYEIDLCYSVNAQSKDFLNEKKQFYIKKLMRNLMPWRKGPFFLYGLHIDAEWRSDWKWERIFPHLSNLKNRIVLDVGCDNGYYLWRIIGSGASLAIGIDPIQIFLFQFEAIRKMLGNNQYAHLLPLKIDDLPDISLFDTIFSMGVIYHNRSPLEHLRKIKNLLVSGGELILETIIIEGDEHTVLVPIERYAKMRNVYFIPSILSIKNWLIKCGFVNIRIVNICRTTVKEQRSTDWMINESLANFLNPSDMTKTIEGYPAPTRAVLIANKP